MTKLTHVCIYAHKCGNSACCHAVPHDPVHAACDKQAPCGGWKNNPDFKPMVICKLLHKIEANMVECPRCHKQYSDETPDAEFIGWNGLCAECDLNSSGA